MKKIFIFLLIVLGVGVLTGCTKKTTTPATTKKTTTSPAADTADVAAKSPTAAATQSASTYQIDTTSIDTTYQKNYTQALTSVNSFLSNQAKFCSVVVEFPQTSIQFADQYFYFTSSGTQINDWYGVAQIDPLQKVVRRMLVARKDVENDIKCSSATKPPSFASAYQTFAQNFPQITTSATAGKTRLALTGETWTATTWDTSGGVIATYQVPTTAATSQTTTGSAASLTPTSGTY